MDRIEYKAGKTVKGRWVADGLRSAVFVFPPQWAGRGSACAALLLCPRHSQATQRVHPDGHRHRASVPLSLFSPQVTFSQILSVQPDYFWSRLAEACIAWGLKIPCFSIRLLQNSAYLWVVILVFKTRIPVTHFSKSHVLVKLSCSSGCGLQWC